MSDETKTSKPAGTPSRTPVHTFTSEILPKLGTLELHKRGNLLGVYLPGGKVFTSREGKDKEEAVANFENLAQFEINRRGGVAGAVKGFNALPEEKQD